MKVGFYPGSFNPWHRGHTDIIQKAFKVFDKIVIAQGLNPDKLDGDTFELEDRANQLRKDALNSSSYLKAQYQQENLQFINYTGLMVDAVEGCDAIIRGLRNGNDLTYEMNQQYWNEDLGVGYAPTVYFICDRKFSHISSTALRHLRKFQK